MVQLYRAIYLLKVKIKHSLKNNQIIIKTFVNLDMSGPPIVNNLSFIDTLYLLLQSAPRNMTVGEYIIIIIKI